MENFFIEYRDPIFSVIILVSIILIISILNYIWGIFSTNNEKEKIEKFIKKFELRDTLSLEHTNFLRTLDIGSEYLGILANIFAKSGDFEKAINTYLIALEKSKNKKEKEFILTNLGKIYFKAGFLQKANDVFFSALKLSPRNEEALKFLMVSYERLRLYKDELDVLDALKELGCEVEANEAYVKILTILQDKNMNFNDKVKEILKFKDKTKYSLRMLLEFYIRENKDLNDFKYFPHLNDCIDIIYFQNKALNQNDKNYKALAYAKGLSDEECGSDIFEINALCAMKKSNFKDARLNFKYICKECKNTIPLFFYRCPMCHSLESIYIISSISKDNNETNFTF